MIRPILGVFYMFVAASLCTVFAGLAGAWCFAIGVGSYVIFDFILGSDHESRNREHHS